MPSPRSSPYLYPLNPRLRCDDERDLWLMRDDATTRRRDDATETLSR
jgi:hypothetical protein